MTPSQFRILLLSKLTKDIKLYNVKLIQYCTNKFSEHIEVIMFSKQQSHKTH